MNATIEGLGLVTTDMAHREPMTSEACRAPLIVMVHAARVVRGPGQTLLTFINYLAPRWRLLVAAPEGPFLDRVQAEAPEAVTLTLPRFDARSKTWAAGAARLAIALRRERGSFLMHANGLSALNLVIPIARYRNVPVLVHFHAYVMTPRDRAHLLAWKRLGIRASFMPVSEFGRGLLEATVVKDSIAGVLPNPIEFRLDGRNSDRRTRPFRIGYVGGRDIRKGLHILIEIADLLRDEDVEWWIYGVDPDLPQHRTPYALDCLADAAQRGLDNLVWCGRFDDPQQPYRSMDALLVPSIKESFGRPALEGMASGLPVVATRVAGLSEVVWDGVSGVLFDPDDPAEGARRLRAIVRDASLRRELAAGAARRADQFDIATVGKSLEDVYRRLLR
jgi:glycosyltransferase involved in cell wall biosynthesis